MLIYEYIITSSRKLFRVKLKSLRGELKPAKFLSLLGAALNDIKLLIYKQEGFELRDLCILIVHLGITVLVEKGIWRYFVEIVFILLVCVL